jgi:hypothetical protein
VFVKRHKALWEKVANRENLLKAAGGALRGKRGKQAGTAFRNRMMYHGKTDQGTVL